MFVTDCLSVSCRISYYRLNRHGTGIIFRKERDISTCKVCFTFCNCKGGACSHSAHIEVIGEILTGYCNSNETVFCIRYD